MLAAISLKFRTTSVREATTAMRALLKREAIRVCNFGVRDVAVAALYDDLGENRERREL